MQFSILDEPGIDWISQHRPELIREEELNFFQVYFITLYLLSVYNIIPEMSIPKQFLGN